MAKAGLDGKAFVKRLREMAKAVPEACGAGLYEEGNRVQEIGVPMTPMDIGTLRGSWYTTEPRKQKGGSWFVEVGVGGSAAPYAIEQHENLNYQHEVGGPKFLENALDEASHDFFKNMAEHMADALKRHAV